MSALSDRTLRKEGLSDEEIEGYRAKLRARNLRVVWPPNLTDAQWAAFMRGADIARGVLVRRAERLIERRDGFRLDDSEGSGDPLDLLRGVLRSRGRLIDHTRREGGQAYSVCPEERV